MSLQKFIGFCASALFLLALYACAVKEPVVACKCDTTGISAEEEAGGCTAEIKEQQCRLYREKEWLQQEEERRRREKGMEPRYTPR